MNKYQKAFYRITDYFHSYTRIDGTKVHEQTITYDYCRQKEVIRELVSKTIPMKPLSNDKLVCPRCNSKFDYGQPYINYCCHCGQRLELEDE